MHQQHSYSLEVLLITRSLTHEHLATTLAMVANRVTTVADSQVLMRHLWEHSPDLLLMLNTPVPLGDLTALCRQVRSYFQTPILVVEEGASEEERIAWLDCGADDVLSLPKTAPAELPARCRALVRRALRQRRRDPASLRMHALGMQLDIANRRLYLTDGQPVALTENLTRFLAICFHHGEALVPSATLGLHIFGSQPSNLQRRLSSLAQALDERTAAVAGPRPHLELVRGNGFRLRLLEPGTE